MLVNDCLRGNVYFQSMPPKQKRRPPGSKKGEPKPLKRSLDEDFPKRLQAAMRGAGFTTSDARSELRLDVSKLARQSGCTRAVIHKYLKGSRTIEAHLLFDLSVALNVSPVWLLKGDGAMAPSRALFPDEARALNLFSLLGKEQRELWLAQGEAIRAQQPALVATKEQPYVLAVPVKLEEIT